MTIKSEPFIKNPLAKKQWAKNGAPFGLAEPITRTSGIIKNMALSKEKIMFDHDSELPLAGKKIRTIRGVVVKAEQETPDTWTLHIFVGPQDKDYQAGQFISIGPHQFPELSDLTRYFEYEKGKKEPVRAYSLTSAPHEKYVSITIKPEIYEPHPGSFPPLLSPILASDILVGREIEFLGFAGGYVMPHDLDPAIDLVVHLVAGSGIVPSYSIIKDELINQKNMHMKHILVDVNKSFKDIIFHRDLMALEKQYPNRLSIKHYLSQENSNGVHGPNYIYGRPSIEHIERLVKDPSKALFFACGPAITKWQKLQAKESGLAPKPRFMEWVQDVMATFKVDKKRFKREIYG